MLKIGYKTMIKFLHLVVWSIFIWGYVNGQCNTGSIASNPAECHQYSNSSYQYCCYLTPISNIDGTNLTTQSSICYSQSVLISQGYQGQSYVNYNGIKYYMNCVNSNFTLISCGVEKPNYTKDCTSASTLESTCCFSSFAGQTKCYYIGSTNTQTVIINGITLDCSSTNLKIQITSLLLIFILFYKLFI
jgi:hypothetical protein